jgi:hypothetical protein
VESGRVKARCQFVGSVTKFARTASYVLDFYIVRGEELGVPLQLEESNVAVK